MDIKNSAALSLKLPADLCLSFDTSAVGQGTALAPVPACREDFLRMKLTSFDKLLERTCCNIKNVRLCSETDQKSGNSGVAPDAAFLEGVMGLSKTEVNLKRLLVTAPQQQNQAKLIHYVATLRELLEQVAEERNPDGLPRVSKAKVNEYAENIEAIAAKLAVPMSDVQTPEEPVAETSSSGTPKAEDSMSSASEGLRRRVRVHSNNEERSRDSIDSDQSTAVKLDDAARTHIEKHRKLQEDLTDEMVILARQLKESSLMMNQSIKNTEKILDSTEKAVEHSLASTGHATSRAMDVYSRSFKTTCFQWLLIFVMTLVFVMVVLLIRVT